MATTSNEALKIYLPHTEIARLRQIAADEDRTVTSLIRRSVTLFLDEHYPGTRAKTNGAKT